MAKCDRCGSGCYHGDMSRVEVVHIVGGETSAVLEICMACQAELSRWMAKREE